MPAFPVIGEPWRWQAREDNRQEVEEGEHESVLPLATEVPRKCRVRLWVGDEGKGEPLLPVGAALQFATQFLEELPRLLRPLGLNAVDQVQPARGNKPGIEGGQNYPKIGHGLA